MTECPCDQLEVPELEIPSGLSALPRQLQAFPEIRRALLSQLPTKAPLASWRARGERDLGLMWLEMWAYVGDVLGFYDERIANETYLRTAVRAPSVRRLVEMLGYRPAPGLAGSALIAALADGRKQVTLPVPTGFRSDAFGDEPPQVFELLREQQIHPFKNQWRVGPLRRGVTGQGFTDRLTFDAAGFALAKDRLVSIRGVPAVVKDVQSVQSQDGQSHLAVTLDRAVDVGFGVPLGDVAVLMPTVSARVSSTPALGTPPPPTVTSTFAFLDSIYRQLEARKGLIVRSGQGLSQVVASSVSEEPVIAIGSDPAQPAALTPVTFVSFDRPAFVATSDQTSFHFAFVPAGRLADVGEVEIDRTELGRAAGLPIDGFVERPPEIGAWGWIDQDFLLLDVDEKGGLAPGRLQFSSDGRARLYITQLSRLPEGRYRLPLTIFGNVIATGHGESVLNEVLGGGDPRLSGQRFKLRKGPLTYFEAPEKPGEVQSSLRVSIDGIEWLEVPSFFGYGPEDRVYVVRRDDAQDSFVVFGDGVRGARVPAGAGNVVANYRVGSGRVVPPALSIKQLARPVDGLRGVRSPLAPSSGRDPEPPELLRQLAPLSALSLGRAVSVVDFEVLTRRFNGVVQASAAFRWLEREQRAGVEVHFIGSAQASEIARLLKNQAERGLPILVTPARGSRFHLSVDVEHWPGFEPAPIRDAIQTALFDANAGLFAPSRATIGGVFWSSDLFEALQAVPGVYSVTRAYLGSIDLGKQSSLCLPPGFFLDVQGSSAQIVITRAEEDQLPSAWQGGSR